MASGRDQLRQRWSRWRRLSRLLWRRVGEWWRRASSGSVMRVAVATGGRVTMAVAGGVEQRWRAWEHSGNGGWLKCVKTRACMGR
jgi:hypothetical protein